GLGTGGRGRSQAPRAGEAAGGLTSPLSRTDRRGSAARTETRQGKTNGGAEPWVGAAPAVGEEAARLAAHPLEELPVRLRPLHVLEQQLDRVDRVEPVEHLA